MRKTLVLSGLFFVSGASALLYQVVWTKKLALLFGVTTYAVSTTLSVFMLGLALGSWFFGSLADRSARPLRVYVWLEAGIAASAGVSLILLELMNAVVGNLGFSSSLSFAFTACRLAGSFAVLIVPTFLMGGTAPVLAKVVIASCENAGRTLGLLYAANTLGGVAGCLLAGFVAIPFVGLHCTLLTGIAGNVAVAFLVWVLFARAEAPPQATSAPAPASLPVRVADDPRMRRAMLAAFLMAGFLGLAIEVAWTRLLLLYLGPTAQAFAAMLAVYLLGLAVGSALSGRYADKWDSARGFALFQVLTGTFILATVFLWLPYWRQTTGRLAVWAAANAPLVRNRPGVDGIVVPLTHAVMLVLAPTFLMGCAFPFGARFFATETASLGKRLGSAYMLNTLGCMLGPLVCGFWWLPYLGLQKTQVLCALGYLACAGLVLAARTPWRRRWTAAGATGLLLVASVLLLQPDRARSYLSKEEDAQLVYYEEDHTGSVYVVDRETAQGTVRRLVVGTTSMMTNSFGGRRYTHLIGDLPLLLHPAPREALVICLGSGMTLSAVASHPDVASIDCADLSEGVVYAARHFFAKENASVLDDPRVSVIVNDGRTHLLATKKRYDVIALEPPPPNNAGVSNLYSVEFYRLCKSRLGKGGMVAQWLPYHCVTLAQAQSVVGSMQAVFPTTTVWELFAGKEFCVIGHEDDGGAPYERIAARLAVPTVSAQLRSAGIRNADDVLACFVMGPAHTRAFSGAAPLITDDQPGLGYDLTACSFSRAPARDSEQFVSGMLETFRYAEDPACFITFADGSGKLAFARRFAPLRRAQMMNIRAMALTVTSRYPTEVFLGLARGFEAPVLLDPDNRYYQHLRGMGVYEKALRRLSEACAQRGDAAAARAFAAQLAELNSVGR
ncbi:MAG: fused MFS/spermidine synthase [Planctomycetota bacterium]|nr:fused MFS/spermidine synthase [Planctomycetota bacterium]